VIALIAFLVVKLAHKKGGFNHVSQLNDLEMEEEEGIFKDSRRID